MHYLTYVFIEPTPDVEDAVAEALAPFAEHLVVTPFKRYLGAEETAAMAECLGVPPGATAQLAERMPEWDGDAGGVDSAGLYSLTTLNPRATWDWYAIGGRWDGLLPGNAASAESLLAVPDLDALLPYDFLTPDGVWHSIGERLGRATGVPGDPEETRWWREEFRWALAAYGDHLVVCVDCHA